MHALAHGQRLCRERFSWGISRAAEKPCVGRLVSKCSVSGNEALRPESQGLCNRPIPSRRGKGRANQSLAAPCRSPCHRFHEESPMPKKKIIDSDFIVFNVIYQDGSLSSNRRIAKEELDIFEPDDSAKAIIEAQDRKIAALSGRPRGPIKSISRAAAR